MFDVCRTFKDHELQEIAFPIGGIGTGTVSLTGNGGLAEWQILHKPNQDTFHPHAFFALWAMTRGSGNAFCRLLEGPTPKPFSRHQRAVKGSRFPGMGLGDSGQFGLPRMSQTEFSAAYPLARIDYTHANMPIKVHLVAYNPMIPMDADDSGLPCALFRFYVSNPKPEPVLVSLMMCLRNPIEDLPDARGNHNMVLDEDGVRGILFKNVLRARDDPKQGACAIASPWPELSRQCCWPDADKKFGWPLYHFWDQFRVLGRFHEEYNPAWRSVQDVGAMALHAELAPGDECVLPFWLAWSFPFCEYRPETAQQSRFAWSAYYSRRFPSVIDVMHYLRDHEKRLFKKTCLFRNDLEASSVDPHVLDAISCQLTPLRSPTTLRMQDGALYGYEGCAQHKGSCPGSCTHVWNYAQAHDFLYPKLAQTMHDASFRYNFSPSGSGGMTYRINVPFAPLTQIPLPAVDGQLGEIIKVYQLWKISGDSDWLQAKWPMVQKALEYSWVYWDVEKKGVPETVFHCTYDINLQGPNPLASGYYIGALCACAEMAAYLGDQDKAAEYNDLAGKASAWMDHHLFNGEYYEQQIRRDVWRYAERPPSSDEAEELAGDPPYQIGRGCLSDQLVGIWLARTAGLHCRLDPLHVKKALEAILVNNWRDSLDDHLCTCRVMALADEAALALCSWPRGDRPEWPLAYADEAGWTGVEYQVAVHLIYIGLVNEALKIVKAVRARFDGVRRNPYNEYECGSYYARGMSAWALLTALSGFEYDGAAGMLGFNAKRTGQAWFWSAQQAWGLFRRNKECIVLEVHHGWLTLRELRLNGCRVAAQATCNGKSVAAKISGSSLILFDPLPLKEGDVLAIQL